MVGKWGCEGVLGVNLLNLELSVCWVGGGGETGGAQYFLLALCSGIIPSGVP